MAHVGFIGLGTMGRPMAGHLIRGGHTLFLASRSGVPGELVAAGGTACASARRVAEQSEYIITMVPDTPDVEQVLFGADGVAEACPGSDVIDMSSISPDRDARVRRPDRRTGAATMSTRRFPAARWAPGTPALTIMCGAAEAAFARVTPLLELMGKTITRVGGVGDGQVGQGRQPDHRRAHTSKRSARR